MPLLGNFFGKVKQMPGQADTWLEAIAGITDLASNPHEIDPTLDTVRTITARLKPGELPSEADNVLLLEVYLRVEQYITTKEPLRAFPKNELRNRLNSDLRKRIEAYEMKG
jgi:hypothetical protein